MQSPGKMRLLREEEFDPKMSESISDVIPEDPCIYLACMEALKNMSVDVRKTKVIAVQYS
jgi:hypothetical protein